MDRRPVIGRMAHLEYLAGRWSTQPWPMSYPLKKYVIYRDTGIVVTKKGDKSSMAKQFMDFLKSLDGAEILKNGDG